MDIVLGIDPGRAGAAVALSAERGPKGVGRVLDSFPWTESTSGGVRGYRAYGEWYRSLSGLIEGLFTDWIPELEGEIGESIRVAAIGVEGMVIPKVQGKGRKSAKSIITLIEETGALVDAVRSEGYRVDFRPPATAWRGRILRLSAYTRRDVAEQYALDHVDEMFASGHGLKTIHEVEAGCIAMYTREAHITGDL